MSVHRCVVYSLAIATTLSALLSGCAGSTHGSTAGSLPSPSPTTDLSAPKPALSSPAAASPSASGIATAALTTYGWIAGFKVAVSQASVDRSTQSLTLDVLVTNTAQRDSGLNAVSAEILLDPGDGSGLVAASGLKPSTDIVAGSTAHGTLSFAIGAGFSLNSAQLILGKPANHQWLVPLQTGRAATGQEPLTLPQPAVMRTASSVYYQITSAQLLPWSCTGITPFTAYIPSDKHVSVVAINGTAGAGQLSSAFGGIESVSITAPDGTTAASTTAPLKNWTSNQSQPNILQCLPVPADSHGVFTITISDQQHSVATATISIP
jgi:hypothetical protein